MTVQTKRFIELSDILGLRIECRGCGCSITMLNEADAIDTILRPDSSVLVSCPSCRKKWTSLEGYNNYDSEMKEFFRRFREVCTLEKAFGCVMSLEISGADSK